MPEQTVTTVETQKSGGSGKTIAIIVVVLLLLCCCCATIIGGVLFVGVGTGVGVVTGAATSKVCESSGKSLSSIYENGTTASYRARVSEDEFSVTMDNLQSVCKELKGLDSFSALTKGLNINYSNDNGKELLSFSGTLGGKKIDLKMVTEGGELKIDELTVK
jgi:hypothetical protein